MRALLAATTAVVLLAATGCSATEDSDDEGTDFWGNPISCSLPAYEEPFPEPAPGAQSIYGRPIDTPEGWGWMVFYFQVVGLASNGAFTDNRYCLPVDIHVYGKAAGAELLMLDPTGQPVRPEEHPSTTPWFGRFSVQYNPADPAFVDGPPAYEIHLDAAYAAERDIDVTQPSVFQPGARASGLGCRIATDLSSGWGDPGTVAVATDVGIFPTKTTATCTYRSNHFNYHG